MSDWTHIRGFIEVVPLGRTQAEKRYVLETVLSHLPEVTGSERNMYTHIIQKGGFSCYDSDDEFGEPLEKGRQLQDEYIIVVEGDFRDRLLEETKREFNEWLTTLCKRVLVDKCLVEITNDFGSKRELINKDFKDLEELFEEPSWMNETSKNWCEKIMWEDKERP